VEKIYNFNPKFDKPDIKNLLSRYETGGDSAALAAGKAIERGDSSFKNLETIFKWKTKGRGISRLKKNTDEEVKDALDLARSAKTPRAAIAVLTGLSGVMIPVASAIMTAIRPDCYTIIDFRALHALNVQTTERTVSFYLAYLKFCLRHSEKWKISLRDFDRALWQWSADHATDLLPKNRHRE